MAEKRCAACGAWGEMRGAQRYCALCLPPPSEVGVTAYRRAHRRLAGRADPEYSRSYYRALRALAKRYPYEFALLLADIRAAEQEEEPHVHARSREHPEPPG